MRPQYETATRQEVEHTIKTLGVGRREAEQIRNCYGYGEEPEPNSKLRIILTIIWGSLIGAALLYGFAFLRGM